MKFLYVVIYFLYHTAHFLRNCGFWGPWQPWADRWREGRCGGSLDLPCLLSHPLSTSCLRKWATCPPPSYLQTSRSGRSFLAPSMRFSSSLQVFALLVFRKQTQQGVNVKGLHGRQSVPPSFLSHLFFRCCLLGEWQRREKEKVVEPRACSLLQKLPPILPTPVQCGLADPPTQKWPLFLCLLGWPCDPATCPQQRHLEWAWASLLGDGKHVHGKLIPIALADAEPVLRHGNEAISVYSCPVEPPAAPLRHSMSSTEVSKVAQARTSGPPAQRRVWSNTPLVVVSLSFLERIG